MIAGACKHITDCNSFKLRQRMISSFALGLMVSIFFTSASFAQDTTPEINPDYLNNLTPDKVTWTKATDEEITAGKDIVLIDGTHYKYSYNKPSGYNETNTPLYNDLTTSNTQSVVFTINNNHAIWNANVFNNPINADFIGNYVKTETSSGYGGAIFNYGQNSLATIGDITGDFIGNYINTIFNGGGGAIFNVEKASIGNINGNFIGNYIQAQTEGRGGAISNYGLSGPLATINDITGDFIGNYIQTESGKGGAIYNSGTINNITGNFVGNYVQAQTYGYGGAIYNYGESDFLSSIGDIKGDFIGNYIQTATGNGGAIYNLASIGNITGDFIGNYVQAQTEGQGGAIYNYASSSSSTTIGNITGDFIGNYVQDQTYGKGGAISNYAYSSSSTTIGNITGDFIGNYVQSQSYYGLGGAISNYAPSSSSATIGNITGDFIGNYVQPQTYGYGGAIYNYAPSSNSTVTIGDITGDFIGNYIQAETSNVSGGAIYNNGGSIGNITGDFIGNYIQSQNVDYGGAIYNNYNATIGNITGDFIGNYIQAIYSFGGAIYNDYNATIGNITGDFIGNYIQAQDLGLGGAICNSFGSIGNINGDFIGNYVQTQSSGSGGAIYNGGTIGDISGDFIGNYVQAQSDGYGGAIYNYGNLSLINANFTDNYAQTGSTTKSYVQGGAIYNSGGTLNITANDGKQSVFDGNKIIYKDSSGKDVEESNSIHMASGTLNLSAVGSGQIIFNDKITATEGSANTSSLPSDTELYTGESGTFYQNADNEIIFNNNKENNINFNLTGDGTGKIVFNNDIEHDGIINVENIEVDVNAQGFDRANLQTGAIVNVGNGGLVKDTLVNQSSLLNIKDGGRAMSSMVANGGKLVVQTGGLANNSVVFAGGSLEAKTNARIHNILANKDAIINLDAGTVLTGNVKFNIDAILQGSFDYEKIFKPAAKKGATLILEGGINNSLNQSSLVNTVQNKKLVLREGDFDVGNGAYNLSGWKELSATNNATIKLVADANDKSQIASDIINMSEGSTLDLAGNSPLIGTINGSINNAGHINFTHSSDGTDDIVTIKGNYKAYKNASMTIDVDPSTNTADLLVIEGDVIGRTRVVIRPTGSGLLTAKALFVSAPNDDLSTGAYFDVYRMDGDARVWNSLYENNKWYVATNNIINVSSSGYGDTDDDEELVLGEDIYDDDTINITTGKPQLVSEAVAYMALPQIGLEQTRDLVRIVSNKVASTKTLSGHCGMSECKYDRKPLNGAWINLGQTKSNLEAPMSVEAKIKAVDLGFDIQQNLNNRLGIFGSYRQGNYDLSGDGKDYYSSVSSEFDIDSWILGLYHRYDKDRIWTMSTLYGGIQQVDLTTDDDVSSDTQGIQFGASIEAGVVFEPLKRLTVEPSIRLGYNFIKYDEMSDNYGKTAEFDNVNNIEAEVGMKVEKTFFHDNKNHSISKIYVKPSIVQNFGKGDVNITSLNSVAGIENQTLIRGELGGSFNFGNGWSGFGAVGYTFGCDYDATDFNLGINYNW